MHPSPLLGPIVALVAWSIIMLIWLACARAPHVTGRLPDGTRGADLERDNPGRSHWAAHNYQHLMEQPTIFYAIVFTLIFMNFEAKVNVDLAWGYVGFRILHSIVQSTVNIVRIRFLLFALSTLCLIGLTFHAALRLIL